MYEKSTTHNRKTKQLSSLSPHTLEQRYSEEEEAELCIEHSCPIQYICFTCGDAVLCAQCITRTSHHLHDLKNIERSRQLLKSQLQEWAIRLESKSEILDVLHDQLRQNRGDIFNSVELYKTKIASEFEQLAELLSQKRAAFQASLNEYTNNYKNDSLHQAEKIRLRRLEIIKMKEINQSKLDKASLQCQAQYYSEKREYVNSLLQEAEIGYYKKQIVEPSWGIDPEAIRQIKQAINKLTINLKYPESFKEQGGMREKVAESLRKSLKKSKKDLKLNEFQLYDSKVRNSSSNCITPFRNTITPKNLSKQKKLKSKKSPGEATLLRKRKKSATKMISMPASPAKEHEGSCHISPDASRKKLFKKK